ncbi:ATP-dependent DNA helicase RecG [Paenibacillus sp. N1-5-1-14]|uniref:ATP-dependent DNA helicase RecG n=1 Tax=Paenibacillus radicibacter TaxID=2972488 RepID=UPI002158B772|nr:ATP-dependent DNA helicase RecG [Paenibacillus radicibacter]MCR8641700.1 ATP-dependent DNA helicase RecG [Paenibacillus radicibacter]
MKDIYTTPIDEINGVGSSKKDDLHAIGIYTVGELLEYYPFRYDDYSIRDWSTVKDGDKITVKGVLVSEPVTQRFGKVKSRMICKVVIDHFFVTAVWFNQAYLKDKLTLQSEIVMTGKWDAQRKQITVAETEFAQMHNSKSSKVGTLQPVYSITAELNQKWMRKTIKQALTQFGALIPEILPSQLLDQHHLMIRRDAIAAIHLPEQMDEGQGARKRMVYEELFLFQLKLHALRTINRKRGGGIAQEVDLPAVRAFVRALPFTLTPSQKQVIAEILEDMQAPFGMNRLLQGDVGAGKTVVAAVSLFTTVKAGYQGALMVPTEILAEQHLKSLTKLFEPYGITVGLLRGSLTAKQRREVLGSLQMGLLDIVVGTHALIQEDVFFRKLGLVVTDEQHRFGVAQRAILRRKGIAPDVLSMTATPIPRTLAISAFGDLDVSSLRELPKGRIPIKTYSVKHEMLDRVLGFIAREVEAGRQAYVICPLIEESEKLDVQNAIDVFVQLQGHFPNLKIGLLHGRMTASEKEEVMRSYKDNELHVLVSTTVIEVGVDVPNATLMVVYDADRFGLSQLHQLRGRVGRGAHASYCVLIANPRTETGKERMRAMVETNDGFEIARRDLELRGPGDFFGTKQSGLPEFRIADIVADFEVMEMARDDAAELVASDQFWTGVSYMGLRQYLQREHVLDGEVLD